MGDVKIALTAKRESYPFLLRTNLAARCTQVRLRVPQSRGFGLGLCVQNNFSYPRKVKTKLNCPCEIFGFAKTHMGKQSVNTAAAARRAAQPLCSSF